MIQILFLDNTDTNTDEQELSLDGNTLMLENGGQVDLTPFLDNTDAQALTIENNILKLSNGGEVDLSAFLDDTDTDEQELALIGNILSLENGGQVDLTPFLDNTDTDDQALSLNGNILSLENGGSIDISNLFTDSDDQELSINGNTLSLENGGSVELPASTFSGPIIFAAGRHFANELDNNESSSEFNSTITRVSKGLFDITFPNIGSSNYIIQITPEDCGGDCPDNGDSGYDDPTVSYIGSTITPTGFRIRAGDNDNGINNLDLADLGFMYSVIQLFPPTSNSNSATPTGTISNDFNLGQLLDEQTNSPWQLGFNGPSYSGSFNYEILLQNVPYTLNNINLGDHTVIENDNGDGTFDYLFTSTSPISGYNQYRQLTADPPAPTPSGSTGSGASCGCVSFYILP